MNAHQRRIRRRANIRWVCRPGGLNHILLEDGTHLKVHEWLHLPMFEDMGLRSMGGITQLTMPDGKLVDLHDLTDAHRYPSKTQGFTDEEVARFTAQ